ncbi:proteoglycan 4 [Aplysia californica]|uniref:Proteoglycan 4 n=1 Tax=Aplysia californica TaxID=6500 RepID=A0ABM0JAQ5_APLCA|nr:proteoglycan 4 [Aplysia californica]
MSIEASPGTDFQLSEKELEELQNIKIQTGLSDSTVEIKGPQDTSNKHVVKKKSWIGPPIPKDRDAMGRYVPPTGGRPLSVQDYAGPGPDLYTPNIDAVVRRGPLFTLGERLETTIRKKTPAPNKYNTCGTLDWKKCKRITIKTNKYPPDNSDKKGLVGPGPASYSLKRSVSQGPKFSMRVRPASDVMPGLVSSLVRQPDPRVPGPDFNPSGCEWLQKPQTFGTKPKEKKSVPTPGPKYNTGGERKGPKWHMGTFRSDPSFQKSPGPGSYDIKSSIGEAPRAVLCSRHVPKESSCTPGPDQYNRAGFDLSEPGYTMKYRWFEPDIERPNPGPGAYAVSVGAVKERAPAYSIKRKTKPTYPSSVYGNLTVEAPSPTQYSLPPTPRTQGKTFGAPRTEARLSNEPGPADYDSPEVVLPKAPAYTMAGRPRDAKKGKKLPGPATYRVKDLPRGTGKTMGVRFKSKEGATGPGPAAYNSACPEGPCLQCESAEGPTLKSRHTPLQYSGLRDTAQLPPQPRGFPTAPLFG